MWSGSKIFPVAGACCVLLLAGVAVNAQTGNAERTDEEGQVKICASAEKRYQKLFSRPSTDEDVTIVMMHKYTFCPPHITIRQGTTVRWVNVDKRTSHSIWFKKAEKKESDRLFGEEQVEITFDGSVGDYPYLCGPHWKEEGMIGTVTVVP